MNFNEYPVLVAPRPVRYDFVTATRSHSARLLTAAVDQFDRFKVSEIEANGSPSPPLADRDLASPRTSSRAGLPSEALEEFLSILRPSFFPPTSPNSMLRGRRQGPSSYERSSYSYKPRRLDLGHQKLDSSLYSLEEIERERSSQLSRNSAANGDEEVPEMYSTDNFTARWHNSSALSSPVSRMHTRNPFQRHPSNDYDVAFSKRDPSPRLLAPGSYPQNQLLSPSFVPLPSPSPEELAQMALE